MIIWRKKRFVVLDDGHLKFLLRFFSKIYQINFFPHLLVLILVLTLGDDHILEFFEPFWTICKARG